MKERSREIFSHAAIYDKVACLLHGAAAQDMTLLLPSVVNGALSLELHFKSLYILDHGVDFKIDGRHSHDFHALFDALHPPTKQFLNAHFDAAISARNNGDLQIYETQFKIITSKNLKVNLEQWSKMFTDLRYAYEFSQKYEGKQRTMLFYPEIRNSIKAAVINREPQWGCNPVLGLTSH